MKKNNHLLFFVIKWSLFVKPWVPFTKRCFLPHLVEIGSLVLQQKILKFCQYFSLFRNYLPLEKGVALCLNKYEIPSPKDALCQVWLKLAQLGSWEKMKKWKVHMQMDRRRSEKLTWAFSSGELKTKQLIISVIIIFPCKETLIQV